jgi:hypothetical protein
MIACLSQATGFVSAGLFYGTISSLFRFFVSNQTLVVEGKSFTQDNAFQMASWFENAILLCYMTLVLISIGMGKGLDNGRV